MKFNNSFSMPTKLPYIMLLILLTNHTMSLKKELKKIKKVLKIPRKTQDQGQNDDDPPDVFCDLAVRPFPLVYYGQTKTMEFRVLFLSSCFDFPVLYYFTLPYNHKYNLFVHTHPTFVRLKLFGRLFDFKFSEAFERY